MNKEPIPLEIRQHIKTRDSNRCRYCCCVPEHPEIDHIIPRVLNGNNELTNLVLACRSCNNIKGADIWHPIPLSEMSKYINKISRPPKHKKQKGTKNLSERELKHVVATKQNISKKAVKRLENKYQLGKSAICDICHCQFWVGIDGYLIANKAALICCGCSNKSRSMSVNK